MQNVRFEKVVLAQARSRAALTHHFELPAQADQDLLQKIAGGDTMVALAASYDYAGARDWARKHNIEFPGVVLSAATI